MASSNHTPAILGGAAIVAVAVGAGLYFGLKPASPPATPPAASQAAAPASPAAPQAAQPATLPAPANQPPAEIAAPTQPPIQTLDFEPSTSQYSVVQPTAAYLAASTAAPAMYTLPAGLGVQAAAQSKDGNWIVAVTQDGQAAYLPAAALGPYQPAAMQSVPAAAQPIAGPATVLDTATLSINGQRVPLFGVSGETGVLADNLQDLINGSGGSVNCLPSGQSYVCLLPNGADVARAALYNGAATPNADATPDYLAQSNAAKQAGRGIWK